MTIENWESKPRVKYVKNQMVALHESVSSFDYIPSEAVESFLWEAMLELWARYDIRHEYSTAPPAYDFFCAWFPGFDIDNV